MKGMNFADASHDLDRIERLLRDDKYVAEQKMDGTRVLITIERGRYSAAHRDGGPLKHTAATQHLYPIYDALQPLAYLTTATDGKMVLDGELLIDTGRYYLFDIPGWWKSETPYIEPEHQYRRRRAVLSSLAMPLTDPVHVVPMAHGEDAKRALLASSANVEGIMLKDLTAAYSPGSRVSHSVKVKHVKTADVVVIRAERGVSEIGRETGSATFGVHDDVGALVPLGSCSLIGKPHVEPGDVIEVAYLYRPTDGSLVQPRLVRTRDDKSPHECTFDQFPAYSREPL